MDTDCKKRQVNADQLTSLLDFLKEHQELARGLTRGRRGKFHTVKIWNLCAKKMNAVREGAVKDGKGWSKYWCDWKYRVRRRALELKAARDSNRPPPEGVLPLTPMEESILGIIGENAVDGVVIKSDPLGDGGTDDELGDSIEQQDDVSISQYYSAPRSSRHKRHLSKDHVLDLDDHSGRCPREKKYKTAQKNGLVNDSDHDDEASEFLRLEREKLDNSKQIVESLQSVRSEITRLVDVMGDIRDMLASNRIHL